MKMLEMLQHNRRILNIDETWVNETSFIRRAWTKRDGSGNTILSRVSPRISMITAIDTDGRVWFALSHANTDSRMMALFLHSLIEAMDAELPGYSDSITILFDNAKYHQSQETRDVIKALGIRLIFSGPYSYSSAVAEYLFGGLKTSEINPDHLPTTKR